MTQNQPDESDWKKFRAIVPNLRERYLRDRNKEFIAILQRESQTPTENFWAAYERMGEIKSILEACLDDHRRSRMITSLSLMYRYQLLADEDLVGFSEKVRNSVANLSGK
jgi:hypothetical protein